MLDNRSEREQQTVSQSEPRLYPGSGAIGTPEANGLQAELNQVAQQQTTSQRPSRRPSLLSYLDKQEELLRAAYRYFVEQSETQLAISYAGEWVLDNFYMIQQTLRQIREDMPQGYYRELPVLDVPPLEGYPRVYAVAREIIRHGQTRVDVDRVKRFVQAYQQFTLLTMGELWALPTMLRVSVLENLTKALGQITGLIQEYDEKELYPAEPPPQGILDEQVVAHGMRSLHVLSNTDWKKFFEAVSRVDLVLGRDPASVYERMDFDTRDRYRKVVEDLALRARHTEEKVAQEAVQLAEESRIQQAEAYAGGGLRTREPERGARDVLSRRAHVGFYLVDRGRAELEARLAYRPSLFQRITRWLGDHVVLVYLGGISLASLAILFALIGYAWVAGGSLAQLIAVALLAAIPATNMGVDLINFIVTNTVEPRVLPKLDLEDGVPREYSTMVVIPALLTSTKEIDSLLHQLELHYLGNADPHLYFALLSDFADAPEKDRPEDKALLGHAQAGIERLNRRYRRETPGPFFFFHREREWNPGERTWMAWERKRGKLAEFNQLLRGSRETSYIVQVGDVKVLPEIRYVITLDADTTLPRESAHRLIGTLAHPLNRAQFDPDTGRVVSGYTILQPRTEVKPAAANQTWFTRIFSGDTGLDLYSRAVSDVYQDLFGEGIYVGKGIYDVDAFERSLAGRIPENTLLSHDLFEGIHGRVGLITDVILYEDYPTHYLAYARRMHRWIRGDWQLLPWLTLKVPHVSGSKIPNTLSVLDRWKVVDNLRRSLLFPAMLAWLVASWLWLPGSTILWTLVASLTTAVPVLSSVLSDVIARIKDQVPLRGLWTSARPGILRWLLGLVFLPYQALIALDAVITTLIRLTITRRRMLQWTTAAHTAHLFGNKMSAGVTWIQMGGAPALALGVGIGLSGAVAAGILAPSRLIVAVPFLLAWLVSPAIARWTSRPLVRKLNSLSLEERQQLRYLARYTWLYFERFVGPDDHWLPPDHFQEDPLGLVAHRTSPTNVGLLLLSTLTAYDLGYVGLLDLALRLRDTFEGLKGLERYAGHFFNWYDTRTLEPLLPRYVSTVDSGNLAASLLILRQGCADLQRDPVLSWQAWQGLLDTMRVFGEILERGSSASLQQALEPLRSSLEHIRLRVLEAQDSPTTWAHLLIELDQGVWQELNRQLIDFLDAHSQALDAATLSELRVWTERIQYHLSWMRREVDMLLPWFALLRQPPSLVTRPDAAPEIVAAWHALVDALSVIPSLKQTAEVGDRGRERLAELRSLLEESRARGDAYPAQQDQASELDQALDWCTRLRERLESGRMGAESLLAAYEDLSNQTEILFREMDFGFLFDAQREVFRIGYNVSIGEQDNSYYDLLASEARIASLLAIAKADVPQSHWLYMARPLTQVDGMRALYSWSGTMFEYLMPNLMVQNPEGTLLWQSSYAAVQHQINYAHQRGAPWGISESAFYQFDASRSYQYRAFGVPGLGLKRGLSDNLVIAPYASLLALSVQPQAVMSNIRELSKLGMLGRYGFYEAIDFTRSRLPMGQRYAIVRSYMVHHQSMILLALVNSIQNEPLVRRLHADPRIQSVELLLHEQVPQLEPLERPDEQGAAAIPRVEPEIVLIPWTAPVDAPVPHVLHLSNGSYGVVITSSGGGYSHCVLTLPEGSREMDLTRWRPDTTLDDWGTWVYVRDEESGEVWSTGLQPVGAWPEHQEVLFDPHKAEFRRRDYGISMRQEVVVPPAENVEIRRVTVTNDSEHPRRLTLTSYGEVVLGAQAVDQRHQAFNKMFIESEYLADVNALLFHRRTRSATERSIYMAHLLVVGEGQRSTGAYETDRAHFLGRGRTPRSPAALYGQGYHFSGTTGATLDPVMILGQELRLDPHMTAQVAYITLVAGSRDEALTLIRRYRAWEVVNRAFDQAQSRSELALSELNLTTHDVRRISELFSALLYPHRGLRADPSILAANSAGQPSLWAYGISGDYPILLVRVSSPDEIGLVGDVLRAHAYWRTRQVKVDLVLLNQRESGYEQGLQSQLYQLVTRTGGDGWLGQRGGIFCLRADQMSESDRVLLATAARVVLDGDQGSLEDQLQRLQQREISLPPFTPALHGLGSIEPTPPLEEPKGLLFDNELGGFSADGHEYVIDVEPDSWTPSPWINVIANPEFGFLVSEAGLGYTWAVNSGENRLTPWRNDPVSDTPAEAIYLRDEETAQVWSPTPLPARTRAPYVVRHGAGYSTFEHNSHGLRQHVRLFAAADAPVKIVQLRLENTWNRERRITATYYAEWVLGTSRGAYQQFVIPEFDADTQALLARNPYNIEFGERVAFLAASQRPHGLTADRSEFLGRMGSYAQPAALGRIGLSGRVEAGIDPCAAMQLHIDLGPGESKEVTFLLGQGANRDETLRLVREYQDPDKARSAWEELTRSWDDLLGTVQVRTPDKAMDLLLNRWLLYQALSCRVWGRSALYQSSGAYGFRDQLQDVMALIYAAPHLTREQIRRSARHQFEAGDVLHWWHPPAGRGVRTRISDDLLWLPYVTAFYVEATGDESILMEEEPFLEGDPLVPEEEEHYGLFPSTSETFTVYEHCKRALDKGSTAGRHGLPLMGAGDWNDGMNRVGIEGKGESVWLGWFLYTSLHRFATLCERMGDNELAQAYRRRAGDLQTALEGNAWDGNWYLRAFYDDGAPLGSVRSQECKIDSIAQSWAVLSGAGGSGRVREAMDAVNEWLVREQEQLLLLFTPPFEKTRRDPGYIKGYPPGIRENGGQYTHAALWAVWAFAELGQGDRAVELFRLLNPISHADTPEKRNRYQVEPYVVAADIYSVAPRVGEGGWTWYTGSSGWMYRLGIEAVLGLRRRWGWIEIDPCIPKGWPGFEMTYRWPARKGDTETIYEIHVENPDGVNRGLKQVMVDGEVQPDKRIRLLEDGKRHHVRVLMGQE